MVKNKPTLPEKTEFKSFHFEQKSIDEDQGIITGYLSTYGNTDLQGDKVLKGAFHKTVLEGKARMQNRGLIWPVLWMHQAEQPIGKVIDAEEDEKGLLITAQLDISMTGNGFNNPVAATVFSGFKQSYISEMSMGYIAIQKDYENGVRNLKECAIVEASAVTALFAANPEALVPASGVKMAQIKNASGKTTWPLADRKLAWDEGEAHNAIVAKATKDDGSLDEALMKSVHFWFDDSAPDKITSYKLLFCDVVGGEIKAIPRGIFACVGGHGLAVADIPDSDVDGIKAKIAAYYKRMASEFDDDSIVPPWEDSGKRRTMAGQRKDFTDIHQAGKAADVLEDWCDLLNDLTQTMFQVFGMSDTPESDMTDCLTQFGDALMKEWLPDAIEADLGQYLNDRGYCSDSTSAAWVPSNMQAGSDYGYMSRSGHPAHKVGRAISSATQGALEQHQDAVKDLLNQHTSASDELASQMKSMVQDHVKSMQQKMSDLTQLWNDEGQGPAYAPGDDKDGKDDGKSLSRFARREPPRALPRTKSQQPPKSTASDDVSLAELESLLA